MNTASKLGAFAAVIAATFGGALAVGAAVGPIDVSDDAGHSAQDDAPSASMDLPRGLAVAAAGYRFALESDTLVAGSTSQLAFRIVDDMGMPITAFDELHERPLHLIVLSRNLVDYLHLHPTMDRSGRWTVELPALTPGSYRVFADFQPTGADNLTLGTDILVPGDISSADIPTPTTVTTVDDYTVTLSGSTQVGSSELSFTVALAGRQVRTDPYLGAAGHLIAIRDGDLAYLHVHPHEAGSGDVVTFTAEFPTAGTYRLFFDFSHHREVRTAAFTVVIPAAVGEGNNASTATDSHGEGH